MTVYYTSNDGATGFDVTTAGTQATSFANKTGTWLVGTTLPPGSHSKTYGSTSKADGDVALCTGITAQADMEVAYSQKLAAQFAIATNAPTIGAVLRSDSANANHYVGLLGHQSGVGLCWFIFKKVSGSYTLLAGTGGSVPAQANGVAAGDTVWIRAQANGTTIRFRSWKDGNPEPNTWDYSGTDSSVSSAGYAGLYYATDGLGTGAVAMGVADFQVASVGGTVLAFNGDNAAIVFSPANWNVGGGKAITACAGAYLRVLFTGSSCTLNFDASGMVTPASQVWWRVDNGAWTAAAVASTVACTVPLTDADVTWHRLEVVVKSTTETGNRWNAGNSTRVIFTGLSLAAGASVAAPGVAPKTVLCFGDSITEGVRTLGENQANDTDRNDAMMGWAFELGRLLGAEVGVIGFGAHGLLASGSGNVPALTTSYALHYAGASRSLGTPDLIVIHEGTNDASNNTVAAMTAVLNALLGATTAKIAVLRPFNGTAQAANLQAAIAACSAPSRCTYVDTAGFFNTAKGADLLALHPTGPNNLGVIAPLVAAQIAPLLRPTQTVTVGRIGGGGFGFRRP